MPQTKRKKKAAVDAGPLRRSKRLANYLGGFKDAASAFAAGYIPETLVDNAEENQIAPINLSAQFDAEVIQSNAPAPPLLPLETIQAIGVGLCKMPHAAVSEAAMNYDSSHDSV